MDGGNNNRSDCKKNGKVSHEENSRTGIALVQKIWPVDQKAKWGECQFEDISPGDMKKSFIAAKKSQKQIKDCATTGTVSGLGANCQLYEKTTEGKIKKWLKKIRKKMKTVNHC